MANIWSTVIIKNLFDRDAVADGGENANEVPAVWLSVHSLVRHTVLSSHFFLQPIGDWQIAQTGPNWAKV